MIVDLNGVASDPFAGKNIDVCICGAGVAGITLALHLPQKLNILLLEGGGFEMSAESQSVYQGESVGQEYSDLTATRLRYFGGTSNHWAGWCRPLDSYDFEPKSYVQYSGWPIRRSDLDPYLDRAEAIVDLSGDKSWDEPAGYFEKTIDTAADFRSFNFKLSPPTRFGQKYRDEIERRSNIFCYLNANVTELRLTENLSRLNRLSVCNYSGGSFEVRAQTFVLAAGGIENPRILLNSNRQLPAGLGNQNGLVGRFFTEHPTVQVGRFILEDRAREHVEKNWVGDSPAQRFKERLRGLICGSEWTHEIAGKVRGKKVFCGKQAYQRFISPSVGFMERERILNFGLRFLSYWPQPGRLNDGTLQIASEQAPNPLSRISLGQEVDKFGLRRVKLNWQLSTIDLHTIQRAVFRFGEVLADLNLGRLRVQDWLNSDSPIYTGAHGDHHMCTTRMGGSPGEGVVDSDQKLFGTDNLYIAGSSVFSTGGHANPTFSIVQMTLRLADHIGALLTR